MIQAEKIRLQQCLIDALTAEGITQGRAAVLLEINQGYISMIKTGSNWKAIKDHIWEKMKAWVDSKLSIQDYRKFLDGTLEPEPEPEEKEDPDITDPLIEEEPKIPDLQGEFPSETVSEPLSVGSFGAIRRQLPKAAFYHEVDIIRFDILKEALLASINMNDALRPDWVEEYNELYGKLEEYQG